MSQQYDLSLPDTLTPNVLTLSNSQTNSEEIWGHLLSQRAYLPSVDLVSDTYKFGRNITCDVTYNKFNMKANDLSMISKEHFLVSRDVTLVPYIKDLSRNGTYINGLLLGRNQVCSLCNNDIIAIGKPKFEAYKYQLEMCESDSEYDRKYRETRHLGRGAFGEVVLAYSKQTCQRYAIKKIPILKLDHGQVTSNDIKIQNEVKILQALKHPCIINFKEILYSEDCFNIVLEYMEGGELHARILKNRRLPEHVAKLYFYQMTLAVQYLHEKGITHRDLKPENILLATKENDTLLKVTDFGLSKFVSEQSMMTTHCGTPCFVAPEILTNNGQNPYTQQVDVWSLGVILFLCLFGEYPFEFDDNNYKTLYLQILTARYTFREKIKQMLSPLALELITKMLVVDPKKRITVDSLLRHPWIALDTKMIAKAEQLMSKTAN